LIRAHKITARKDGKRTLVDYESVKTYYAGLPVKADHSPLVFGERAYVRPKAKRKIRH
jgi:hypothetical protein